MRHLFNIIQNGCGHLGIAGHRLAKAATGERPPTMFPCGTCRLINRFRQRPTSSGRVVRSGGNVPLLFLAVGRQQTIFARCIRQTGGKRPRAQPRELTFSLVTVTLGAIRVCNPSLTKRINTRWLVRV